MSDEDKTQKELISEVEELRRQLTQLEALVPKDAAGKTEEIAENTIEHIKTLIWQIAIQTNTESEMIKKSLEVIGPGLNADRTSFYRIHLGKKKVHCEIQWHKEEMASAVGMEIPFWIIKNIFDEPFWMLVSSSIPMFAKPVILPLLKKYQIKSLLVVPWGDPGRPRGILLLSDCRRERSWNHQEITVLHELCKTMTMKANVFQSEQRMRESEARYRSLYESSSDAVMLLDESSFFHCNSATLKMFACNTRDDFCGKHPSQFSPPTQPGGENSLPLADQHIAMAMQKGRHQFEWLHQRLDGTVFPADVLLNRLEYDDRVVLQAVVRDITERKKSEEELMRIRQAVDASFDGIVMADASSTFFYQNKSFSRMFGYTYDELNALGLEVLYQDRTMAGGLFQSILDGNDWNCETTALTKDHKPVEVLLRANAVNDELGNGVGFIITHTDITDRKRIEEALRKAKQETEEVNRKLEQSSLRAKEMAVHAKMASRAKSDFLATMSHEIRTPMNAIIGMTGLLLETELDADQREFTETVKNSANALLTIVNDILDFSKVEAGKLELENLDFNLRVTLEDTSDVLAHRAQNKNLEFVCIIEPEVPSLLQGDPGRLRQVLINLTNNAIKFTHEGEVALRAGLVDENDREVTLHFSVSDTGIGIPQEKQSMLFEAFTQVDASNTRQYEGTGLGLSISKRLTQLMHGEIGMDSREGKGSTFWFTAVFKKQPKKDLPVAEMTSISGRKILVIDDNATNRRWLTLLLKSWNCYYAEAADAQAGLNKLRAAAMANGPFDAAIIDWQMPVISGEALGRMIKEDERIKQTKLVMMTSVARAGDAKRLEKIGFDAYLTKPVKQKTVYDCLSLVWQENKEDMGGVPRQIITRHTIADIKRSNLRILVAEDNVANQKVVQRILDRYGYRVDAVANGLEAVQALESIPYDLVLLDCQMPEMDGFKATRMIRRLDSMVLNHNIPIIAMTANAMHGDRERCILAGMDDYVSKPIDLQTLLDVIERWLIKKNEHEEEALPLVEDEESFPVFDKEDLLKRMMNDESYAKILVEGFLKDMPDLLEEVDRLLEKGDADGMKKKCHAIKGAAGNVGGKSLQNVAYQMEQAAGNRELKLVAKLNSQLKHEFARMHEVLDASGFLHIQL